MHGEHMLLVSTVSELPVHLTHIKVYYEINGLNTLYFQFLQILVVLRRLVQFQFLKESHQVCGRF